MNWPHKWILSSPQMISAILFDSPSVYAQCESQNCYFNIACILYKQMDQKGGFQTQNRHFSKHQFHNAIGRKQTNEYTGGDGVKTLSNSNSRTRIQDAPMGLYYHLVVRWKEMFYFLWPAQLTSHTLTCSCLMDSDFSEHFISERRRFSWPSKRLCSAALSNSG